MTATTKTIDAIGFRSRAAPGSPLHIAREILEQVRHPEAIFLQDIQFAADRASGLGQFLCHRSSQFPNPGVSELTGGQLIDSASQMAYCVTGLMIHSGVDLLGLDFRHFKDEIHAHRIHAVRTDIAFRHPCRVGRLFSIRAKLRRFRNGELTISKREPRRYFVSLDLEASQSPGGGEGRPLKLFRARIAACRSMR